MRLAALHLEAFGHFSDVRVELEAGAPALHVVYGHNEAGKSTTLRAVRGLFFGIPRLTRDAHRHPMPKLRIGATIVAEDGSVHEVVRKKGRKNTLLGPDGEPIDEALMRGLLAHVGAEQFQIMFGLDHVSLREGAAALLSSGGDVGESLYGASLGGSIHEVITDLEEEAAALFTARGKQKPLNAALAEYKEARARLREAGFTPESYGSQLAALETARAEVEVLRTRRSALHAERGRVGRAVRVMPGLAMLRRLVDERAALPEPGSLASVRDEVLGELRHDHHVVSKSNRDLPNREAARDDAMSRAAEILGALGAEPTPEAGRALLPSAREREAIWRLIEQHGELVTDVRNASESLDEKRAELARLEEHEDEATPGEDLTKLEAALSSARSLGDAAGTLAALGAEVEERLRAAERMAAALTGFAGDAAAAASLPVPDPEVVEADAETHRSLVRRAEDANAALAESRRSLDVVEEAIAADDRHGRVPTEAELTRQRRARDRLWAALRRSMEASPRDEGGLDLDAVDPDGYEDSVAEADESADVMRREADRVAQRARRNEERAQAERQVARAEVELAEATSALEEHDESTRARWREIGVDAEDAEAMRRWCSRHAEVLRSYVAVETKRTERAALAARIDAAAAGLRAALGSEEDDLAVLVQRAEARLEAARRRRAKDESRRERHAALETDVARIEKRLAHREAALTAWREGWATRATALGLPPDASPRRVSEVLESLNALEKALTTLDDEEARIDKMRADAKRFDDEVEALIRDHAPELLELPPSERAPALIERIEAAHDRAREAKRLDTAIREKREELLEAGDGLSIDELEAETEGLDLGQQRGRASNIDEEVEELNEEIRASDREVATLELGVERYRERTSAAEAADEAEEVLTRVREAAHRYVRLRLAVGVLRAEIARFREENQGPILERANTLFPRLTRGAYEALRVVSGDDDEPVLSCVRVGGAEVGVDGLSDGTKDQLYLALRLSTLLHFAEQNEPLPLILDDCLVHFDDDRARAALEVLGEVSRTFQILFFTHHRRLVELANEAVPAEQLRVCDLGEVRARAEARA